MRQEKRLRKKKKATRIKTGELNTKKTVWELTQWTRINESNLRFSIFKEKN